MESLSLNSIVEAKQILNKKVKRTPLNHSTTFSKMTSCEVYLKHENLQKAGSFKVRGAYNKIAHLDKSMREKGVVAVSTGNHAQGVALAASLFGISATIVMPKGVPIPKIEATKGYGGTVILYGESFEEAYTKALEIAEKDGLTLIHAFDDQYVAAGQGTIGLEILEDLPEVDLVICPIGGGGLISGIATAIKAQKPSCRIIGVQTEEMSAAYQSIKKGTLITTGKGNTIANGIAIKSPSKFTFSTMKSVLDDVVIVKEREIAEAILLLLERCKTIAEGAGAVSLAALLNRDIAKKEEKIVLIVSGGNIDSTILGKIITQGLIKAGRYHELEVLVEDKPGKLEALLEVITAVEGNVVDIEFDRYSHNIPFGYVGLHIALETKNHLHSIEITEKVMESYNLIHE
ncbi:MAG: threonine ammonia-lyase [Candidatus Hodarchaeales archaeon]|jgi:threonine dehydratase